MQIGVLALQGDFLEHSEMLDSLGVKVSTVRLPRDLDSIDGLILPGGESTTISKLLETSGLKEALLSRTDLPVFGTCAGLILMSRSIVDGRDDQFSFGYLDVEVRRNGFGRQIRSFEADIDVEGVSPPPMKAVFIRAPVITGVDGGVEVLGRVVYDFGDRGESVPVVVRQGSYLASAFHPELTSDSRLHRYFLEAVVEA
ncbi:pyridoxal phosphate synthase yaaE subunit [Ferrithrix thermotolerans DSM 19514]|uniref:Pyridoxal 5'-phosphate synthase subunit PdxT n=1 Tax=Ferrithrix thermotolerans DSM 19514 TaxID=1121881 RepID=A0A1M4SIB9_9ACTN|nr:pyridoxal 5'-phosphate synthase glutaminase subunit PdxT [Ferrithrix thermotolerans]SHE32014.1 pyridoxal phosphate synthase yaaE subunit [Ferrithrix thermotolerans DSM 19514]